MATEDETSRTGGGKLWLIAGAVLLLAGAGGGYAATKAGFVPIPEALKAEADAPPTAEDTLSDALLAPESSVADVGFVPIDPLIVSLGDDRNRRLRFRAQLEISEADRDEVEHLMPRIVDVMNAYLRAADPADLEARGALVQLRAQLLRRVELVVGAGKVGDILVMEYVFT